MNAGERSDENAAFALVPTQLGAQREPRQHGAPRPHAPGLRAVDRIGAY
jgi:hypothetical protein